MVAPAIARATTPTTPTRLRLRRAEVMGDSRWTVYTRARRTCRDCVLDGSVARGVPKSGDRDFGHCAEIEAFECWTDLVTVADDHRQQPIRGEVVLCDAGDVV